MTLSRSMPLLCMLAASAASAQGPMPPTPPTAAAYAARAQRYAGADRNRDMDRGPELRMSSGNNMGIVPSGTWWKNPDTISALSLTAVQQTKMDDIFRQNRIALIDVKASLEKEEINLEPLLNANPVDSAKALVEISKIADLRAGLEKANAKMLLGLRALLTADQWTKLQDLQHMRRKGPLDSQGPGTFFGQSRGKGSPAPGNTPAPPPPPPVQK